MPVHKSRFALNRIIAPSLGMEDFFKLSAETGLAKVELRNDLAGRGIIDSLKPREALDLARRYGLEIITVNALQKFNLAARLQQTTEELKVLLDLCAAIRCKALVLCPNNDPADKRSAAERLEQTGRALRAFGPLFEQYGMLGYIEPLGFSISSLASLDVAAQAVAASGFGCYRLVHDTFHHYLGPDGQLADGAGRDASLLGLVHVSGVEAGLDKQGLLDEHRLLPSPADRMRSREQILRLEALGYRGDISFEPFSPAVQALKPKELVQALRQSLDYLLS